MARYREHVGAALLALTALVLSSCTAPGRSASEDPSGSLDDAADDAAGEEAPDAKNTLAAAQGEPLDWRPPAPDFEGSDWIQLKSGEWLKGELKYLRDDDMEFESDELDTLQLDWEDVHALRSPRTEDVVLPGRRVVAGTIVVDRETIRIQTADGLEVYPRADIVSIVPDARTRRELWSGNLGLGLSLQSGNTEQSTFNAQAKLRRRGPFSRVSADYIGNVGSVEGVSNIDNHRADGRWDLFISQRWFVTPAQLTWFRDPFQNIAHQVVPSAGVGYHLVREGDTEWTASLNAGAQYTDFVSVGAGESGDEVLFTFIPGTNLDWDITKDLEWVLDYSLQVPVPETVNRVFHLATTISLDLAKDLDLDVTFQWDHVSNPQPRGDGTVPEADDYRLSVGVAWDF